MRIPTLSKKLEISKIQKQEIYSNAAFETLIVSLEKGMEVPPQPAPADAGLYVIQGKMEFDIEGKTEIIEKDDFFSFRKNDMHGLKALEDSRFLISRIHP